MSETRPRPRPRPRPAPRPVAASSTPSSPGTSTAGTPSIHAVVEDEDSLFMRNQSRDFKTWKKLKELDTQNEVTIIDDSDNDSDESRLLSPRSRHRKKKYKDENSRPEWTKTIKAISLSSSDEDDARILRRLEKQPEIPEVDNASLETKKRPRSRSRSITPPPALPQHALLTARQTIRQLVGITPRPASPTWNGIGDDSTDTIILAPELAEISRQVKNQRKLGISDEPNAPQNEGGPEVVTIKVKWRSHPLNPNQISNTWVFKMKRGDMFRTMFNDTADLAGMLSSNLVVTYENSRVFPSATPHSIGIWAEGELEACDGITYEYLRAERRQRSQSVEPAMLSQSDNPIDISESESSESDAEPASGGDTFRLTLRSGKTKDVVLTVRQTTTCGAIVKAFLKKAGLADQYAAPNTKKKRGRASAARAAGPCLMVDGDKMKPESAIGDADLEDGDLVEVVGL